MLDSNDLEASGVEDGAQPSPPEAQPTEPRAVAADPPAPDAGISSCRLDSAKAQVVKGGVRLPVAPVRRWLPGTLVRAWSSPLVDGEPQQRLAAMLDAPTDLQTVEFVAPAPGEFDLCVQCGPSAEAAAIDCVRWTREPDGSDEPTPCEQPAPDPVRDSSGFDLWSWPCGGLGVAIKPLEEGVRVVGMEPGGGAEAAGLEVGDLLLRVDGRPLQGLDARGTQAVILGAAGTLARTDVQRKDGSTDTLDVRRRHIRRPGRTSPGWSPELRSPYFPDRSWRPAIEPVDTRQRFEPVKRKTPAGYAPFGAAQTAGTGALIRWVRPAARRGPGQGGVQVGDTIVAVDGHDTTGLSLKEFWALLPGDVGSEVRVSARTLGGELIQSTFRREVLPARSTPLPPGEGPQSAMSTALDWTSGGLPPGTEPVELLGPRWFSGHLGRPDGAGRCSLLAKLVDPPEPRFFEVAREASVDQDGFFVFYVLAPGPVEITPTCLVGVNGTLRGPALRIEPVGPDDLEWNVPEPTVRRTRGR